MADTSRVNIEPYVGVGTFRHFYAPQPHAYSFGSSTKLVLVELVSANIYPAQNSKRSAKNGSSGRRTRTTSGRQMRTVRALPTVAASLNLPVIPTSPKVPTTHPAVVLNCLRSATLLPVVKSLSNTRVGLSRCTRRSRATARSTLATHTRPTVRVNKCTPNRELYALCSRTPG